MQDISKHSEKVQIMENLKHWTLWEYRVGQQWQPGESHVRLTHDTSLFDYPNFMGDKCEEERNQEKTMSNKSQKWSIVKFIQ